MRLLTILFLSLHSPSGKILGSGEMMTMFPIQLFTKGVSGVEEKQVA
jgi:hypothetical protein